MNERWLLAGVMPVLLAGCAQLTDETREIFATRVEAHGVMQGTLLSGKVTFYTDRLGTVSLTSASEPRLTCMGRMNFTATPSGVANLRCSDNAEVSVNFTMATETRGFASGRGTGGPATLAFGMPLEEARAYLQLPPGQRLVIPGPEVGGPPRLEPNL